MTIISLSLQPFNNSAPCETSGTLSILFVNRNCCFNQSVEIQNHDPKEQGPKSLAYAIQAFCSSEIAALLRKQVYNTTQRTFSFDK